LKSCLKLYGPSIDKGWDALEEKFNELKKHYPYGDVVFHAISIIDPTYDAVTGRLVREVREELGEYDFVVEWNQEPTIEQVRGLIRQVDEALMYSGCRYTITTK
jgi:hypothetical protein